MNDELTPVLDRISELDQARAVVLTGAGKVFCAGADLKSLAEVIKGPGDLPGAWSLSAGRSGKPRGIVLPDPTYALAASPENCKCAAPIA